MARMKIQKWPKSSAMAKLLPTSRIIQTNHKIIFEKNVGIAMQASRLGRGVIVVACRSRKCELQTNEFSWHRKKSQSSRRCIQMCKRTVCSSAAPPPAPPPGLQPGSAYVHLPFCKKKCRYCDFPVIAVGMRPDGEKIQDGMADYVDTLCREIAATKRLHGDDKPLQTVFFGGGTPSLIRPALLESILGKLESRFGITTGAEISIEADPGTFDAAQLRTYRDLGITRVSVGVQSFDDSLLTTCGRAHDVADVYRAIEAVYAANVPSWSLDLMSGLPGLTQDGWEASIAAALDAAPSHVSVYDLQIEEHTPFAKQYRPGEAPLPSDEATAAMYGTASVLLRGAGFEHYEISNYAKPGHRCAHNMTYWEGRRYYAFGLGAASYLEGRRFSRPKRIGAYAKWVEGLEARVEERAGRPVIPGVEFPEESVEDRLTDRIMLKLRLADGLDLRELATEFEDGGDAGDVIVRSLEEHVQRGHVELIREEVEDIRSGRKRSEVVKVKLTDPAGFLMSNDVVSDIFVALDEVKDA